MLKDEVLLLFHYSRKGKKTEAKIERKIILISFLARYFDGTFPLSINEFV
jgi:hypothetical protein